MSATEPKQPVADPEREARTLRLHQIASKATRDPTSLTLAELDDLVAIVTRSRSKEA